MDSSVSLKDQIWFLRVCHHISNAVYILTYLHTALRYGPLTAFASLITDAHSSLTTAFCRYLPLIPRRSLSTFSSHLNLGLPLLLLPYDFTLKYSVLPWSILCPARSSVTISLVTHSASPFFFLRRALIKHGGTR